MQHASTIRVVVSSDADALIHQGCTLPSLFITATDVERWYYYPDNPRVTFINSRHSISMIETMIEAHAEMDVIRKYRPPLSTPEDVCIQFCLPTALKVGYVGRDTLLESSFAWFADRGFNLVASPNALRIGLQPAVIMAGRIGRLADDDSGRTRFAVDDLSAFASLPRDLLRMVDTVLSRKERSEYV